MAVSDGYIRLTFADFCALRLSQCMAWRDMALLDELRDSGLPVEQAGYCEWSSEETEKKISLGWAWFRPNPDASPMVAPGGISSNMMLCSHAGYDLGMATTEQLLMSWLAGQPWQLGLPEPLASS
ncbi:DUF4902 domain-containing protein [Chitinimonas arctica]|nr:DUF4902 domain-containing protein [Chitinimonas arctica]